MIRMTYECTNCKARGDVENITNIDGCCPNCHEHLGEVNYFCNMSLQEFLEDLRNMNDAQISKSANAIRLCANDLLLSDF